MAEVPTHSLLAILQSPMAAMLLMVMISVVYFVSDRSGKISTRLIGSAYGLFGAALLFMAMVVWHVGAASTALSLPYTGLFLIPLASIIYSFMKFGGNPFIHFLQIPNLLCLGWAWLIGLMAVSDQWL